MDQLSRDDLERMIFFEQAKEQAEEDIRNDPKDSSALTRRGGALLELAHFRQGHEAFEMMDQAVENFHKALKVTPRKHETLWCLGNALTSQGFLTADAAAAENFFKQAQDAFSKAVKEDPSSEVYKKALDMTHKAPALHAELQKQLQAQPGGLTSRESAGPSGPAKPSDLWYDAAGWLILVGLGVAWVSFARTEQAGAASAMK